MKKACLLKGKEKSILRKHPWIFSGAIDNQRTDHHITEGDIVQVEDFKGNYLGTGYWGKGSIRIKILDFQNTEINADFWKSKISNAWNLRQSFPAVRSNQINAYRLIHAEGDGIPGLIADYYNGCVVIQCHEMGIYHQLDHIIQAFKEVGGNLVSAIYVKSQKTLKTDKATDEFVMGQENKIGITEFEKQFEVDIVKGQKTGFFLDQRISRLTLQQMAHDKSVLNMFSYTGGFSLAALIGGANQVVSVDSSSHAIEKLEQNLTMNEYNGTHESVTMDAVKYLNALESTFDIIVLDPPAYAKSIAAKHRAIQAYRRINELAMHHLTENGLLFTYSCSQAIDQGTFEGILRSAGINAKKNIQILEQFTQPMDHPVNLQHPEGRYLKGLLLQVSS